MTYVTCDVLNIKRVAILNFKPQLAYYYYLLRIKVSLKKNYVNNFYARKKTDEHDKIIELL